jgi:hypothetical protein
VNILRNALVILLLTATTAMAEPASESSIKQLLAVTQAKKLLDGMQAQLDSLMDNVIQQALKGKSPTAKQQEAITHMKNNMVALLQGDLAWEKLEPMYLRLYTESFTEEEVGGMLAFYKTPAGQAVINKMPVLMQKTMLEVQKMSSGLAPRMQEIQKDFAAEMKSAEK